MMKKLAFAFAAALAFGNAYAFHAGGVAACESCHTMHNSLNGAAINTAGGTDASWNRISSGLAVYQSGPFLLKGQTATSACLNCHENAADTAPSSYHVSTTGAVLAVTTAAPIQRGPGGDFGWLKAGTANTNRGHSIVAPDFGYAADTNKVGNVSPGGSYPAGQLHCSSCHDPHGKYRRDANGKVGTNVAVGGSNVNLPIVSSGSYNNSPDPTATTAVGVYRFLGGIGYQPVSSAGAPAFTANPPVAVAPSAYNRSETIDQTRVAYGAGMSEWCANCHASIHQNNATVGNNAGLVHPAGANAKFGATILANYQAYVSSGNLSGTAATSYNSLVPYEENVTDSSIATYTALKAKALNGNAAGPTTGNENAMCLSCHRVHASAFPSMLRYEVVSDTGYVDATGATYNASQGFTATQMQAAYYDRAPTAFAPFQRALCNKCHLKD